MTYEYECQNADCQHRWEQEQKITAPAELYCPKCSERTAKRLISGGQGFQLKGEGWYKTGGY